LVSKVDEKLMKEIIKEKDLSKGLFMNIKEAIEVQNMEIKRLH